MFFPWRLSRLAWLLLTVPSVCDAVVRSARARSNSKVRRSAACDCASCHGQRVRDRSIGADAWAYQCKLNDGYNADEALCEQQGETDTWVIQNAQEIQISRFCHYTCKPRFPETLGVRIYCEQMTLNEAKKAQTASGNGEGYIWKGNPLIHLPELFQEGGGGGAFGASSPPGDTISLFRKAFGLVRSADAAQKQKEVEARRRLLAVDGAVDSIGGGTSKSRCKCKCLGGAGGAAPTALPFIPAPTPPPILPDRPEDPPPVPPQLPPPLAPPTPPDPPPLPMIPQELPMLNKPFPTWAPPAAPTLQPTMPPPAVPPPPWPFQVTPAPLQAASFLSSPVKSSMGLQPWGLIQTKADHSRAGSDARDCAPCACDSREEALLEAQRNAMAEALPLPGVSSLEQS